MSGNLSKATQSYTIESVKVWETITKKQFSKDKLFMDQIKKFFIKGPTLELGSGVGQLSKILSQDGYEVTASDYHDHFVEHMKNKGIHALVVDATNISASISTKFSNVFTQGVSSIVQPDLSGLRETYQSVYDILEENGRFIVIHGGAYSSRYNSIEDHKEIYLSIGFKFVKKFRNQILPSYWYKYISPFVYNIIENTIGYLVGTRYVLILEK